MTTKTVRFVLCGLGNVGRALIRLIHERGDEIEEVYGIRFVSIAAVDIGGAAVSESEKGLPLADLESGLQSGLPVEKVVGFGFSGKTGAQIIQEVAADMLVEATPTNLTDGEPGTAHIRAALSKGMDVVSANKGPLVLYYADLHQAAAQNGCRIHMSAATAAALPTLDVAEICLAGSRISAVEGILNGTTNFILTQMEEQDWAFDRALAEAQRLGIAETDPSYDIDGHDTANKIILIANRVFGTDFGPGDVSVEGIRRIQLNDIALASGRGMAIKLIGSATRKDSDVILKVAPEVLDAEHPLALINGSEKAVTYRTDTMDQVTVSGGKSSPVGAAAALLKDMINAYRKH